MGTLRKSAASELSVVVHTSAEPDARPFYRPELDAIRFFAFLGVFSAHAHMPDTGVAARVGALITDLGKLGVMLFFLLSAYLITELLRREKLKTGTVNLKKFYLRRVLRIWPLYMLMTAIALVVGVVYKPWHITGLWLLSSLFFSGNWFVAAFGWPANLMVCPLWTISVEEQFYVLIPSVQKLGGARAVNAVSWLFLAAAYAYLWLQGLPHQSSLFVNSLVMFQFFAAGSLLANYLEGATPVIKLPYRILMLLAGLGLWLVSNRLGFAVHFKENATRMTPVYGSLALLAGTLLIFLAFLGVTGVKFPRPILYLGTISYGLYIYHVGLVSLIGFLLKPVSGNRGALFIAILLSMAASIVVASASYKWVELPFIQLKRRFELIPSKG